MNGNMYVPVEWKWMAESSFLILLSPHSIGTPCNRKSVDLSIHILQGTRLDIDWKPSRMMRRKWSHVNQRWPVSNFLIHAIYIWGHFGLLSLRIIIQLIEVRRLTKTVLSVCTYVCYEAEFFHSIGYNSERLFFSNFFFIHVCFSSVGWLYPRCLRWCTTRENLVQQKRLGTHSNGWTASSIFG